jgi:Arc/MetJ-type ribon-helix-helix transcriptional regulator
MYTMKTDQKPIPVKLAPKLKEDIDELVRLGVFSSRSEAIKFSIRLMLLIEKMELPISRRAEEYAYEEIKEKFKRIRDVR